MAKMLERLNEELESLGKKAQQVLDDGKLQLERFRLQRERDEAARRLGYLVHRRERGRTVDAQEIDAWLQRMDQHDVAIETVERKLSSTRGEAVTVRDAPAPAGAQTAESEVVGEPPRG